MKIDWRFVAIPSILLMILLGEFLFLPRLGDYEAHLGYACDGNYPRALCSILGAMNFMPRPSALFLVSIFFSVYLPYVLVFEITKNIKAAWVYIFASSIPFMLASTWFVPQAIIQSLMLLSIWNPTFLVAFLAFGWLVHSAWWAAFILTIGFIAYRKSEKFAALVLQRRMIV